MGSLTVTVSGSFRRAMSGVQDVVADIIDAGGFVLSPADPRIVDAFGDFVFVASDRVRQIRTVQERHLAAIAASDLLWLVAPEGYVGQSAAMEIGYAAAVGTPIFSDEVPGDLTLRQWVRSASSPRAAMAAVASTDNQEASLPAPTHTCDSLLLNPVLSLQASHDDLLIAQAGLLGAPSPEETDAAERAMRRINRRTALSL